VSALLLFIGLAHATGLPPVTRRVPSKATAAVRFRYTDTNRTGSAVGGVSGDCVQGQCFTLDQGAAWTQRTEVSARIADKRWVGLTIGTDADFSRFRSIAASLLGDKWVLAFHYGAFPQSYEVQTVYQTQAGYYLDPDVLPDDTDEPRIYRRVDALAYLVQGHGIDLFLGGLWIRTTQGHMVHAVTQDNVEPEDRLAVYDTHSEFAMAGITGGFDTTPYVLRRKCPRTVCLGFSGGQSIKLGPARVRASSEAEGRYEKIFSEAPEAVWGLGWGTEAHLGIMAFRQRAWGTVGVDVGYTGDIDVFRWGADATTGFDNIGSDDGPRSRFTLYHGPYIQGTGRF